MVTESEVQTRRKQGWATRSRWSPVVPIGTLPAPICLPCNILFTIAVALVALGRYSDALTSVGLGLVNALISTVQEIRAKRQLDQIALVNSPIVTVVNAFAL